MLVLVCLLAGFLGTVLLLVPDALAQQSGNDVATNLGRLLKRYAAQVYGGVLAIVSVVFLINRKYHELALFFLAAVLVGWLVFASGQVGDTAESIAKKVLTGGD